jgi:hypothetical protein
MTVAIMRKLNSGWHFHCPECGMGDEEVGQLVHVDEIYCEICISESELYIRLHRWPADFHDTGEAGGECFSVATVAGS